ncbi:MAG TPA: carboxypeptidase regulatory-like domain-containing protein [Anaeromyxobacter sp.]
MTSTLLALVLAATPIASNFVPAPPGELRGQVMGPSGAPVRQFTVNGVEFKDPEGRFKVLTPPDGEFRVVIRADGFAPNVFHVQGASGKKLQIPEIRLGSGEHVLGEVLDAETGMPVPEARASLADPAKLERLRFIRPERVAPLGVSGAGGWYELRRAPRGLLVLVVSAPGYLTEFVPVNTRDALPSVQLHRGGTLAGNVHNAAGAPIPGARVLALSKEANDGAEGRSDRAGRFEFEKLRPGRYRVVALAAERTGDAGEVEVQDGAVTEVSLRVSARESMPLASLP